MKKGDIVLVEFPFSDFSEKKLRPALALTKLNKHNEICLAFISSNISNKDKFDIALRSDNPDFNRTGLKVSSILKTGKIVTINKKLIKGKIGAVNKNLQVKIDKVLKEMLML